MDHVSDSVSSNGIVVEPTPVGYLCVGFGEAARTLRFVFDDGVAARRAFAEPTRLASTLELLNIAPVPVAGPVFNAGGDLHLSRLASIASLAKYGRYNPDEPRDSRGRWTSASDVAADDPSATREPRGPGPDGEQRPVRLAQELLLGPPPSFLLSKPPVGIDLPPPEGLTPLEELPPGSAGGPGAGKPFPRSMNKRPEGTPCAYCGTPTTRNPGSDQHNGDHNIPRSQGGNNSPENRLDSCRTCNLRKGGRTPQQWYDGEA